MADKVDPMIAVCLCTWHRQGVLYSGSSEGNIFNYDIGLGHEIAEHRLVCQKNITVFGKEGETKPLFTL